ncbi:MAG: OmpA family protein [Cytophagales bacterium]|nr:OmpA family protein [Cytophagales bacterium]
MMIHKISYCLFFLLLSMGIVEAQYSLRKANKYYDNFSYTKAIESYKKTLNKKNFKYKDSVYVRLADCYHKIHDFEQTKFWFEKVEDINNMKPIDVYWYAEALINLGKYEEAKPLLEKFHELNPDDDRFALKIEALGHLNDYFTDSAQYKINLMSINSPQSDFSPTFYREGILFVSGRERRGVSSHKFEWDNSNFLDLYYTEVTETGIFKEPEPFNYAVNSNLHEGPATFNQDEDFILFTRNNVENGKKGKNSAGIHTLMIYQAEKKAQGWGRVRPFQLSSSEYSIGHPSLSPDGKTLFFVGKNLKDGYGESDLYVTHLENETWSEPQNLGHDVNTAGHEMFPFLHEDGKTLYFASDGQGGIGGLDIFVAHWNDSTQKWGEVENMGYPLNTRFDDFGVIMDKSKRFGFLTSNRPGGIGKDDIYEFEIIDFGEVVVEGQTFALLEGLPEEKREILANATLSVYDSLTNEKVTQASSTVDGIFDFTLRRNKTYQIIADHPSLTNVHDTLYVRTFDLSVDSIIDNYLTLKIPLGKKVHFSIPVANVKTKDPVANAFVQIMNLQTKEIQKLKTDSTGLIDIMLDSDTDYIIHGSKPGYFSNCIRITAPSPTPYLQSPKTPLVLEEIQAGVGMGLSSVYFASNSAKISKNAAKELDEIVRFLQNYPEVKIEISSHTDSRGSDIYNERLSMRRSRNAVKYIIENGGIDPKRVIAKGYGETRLVNRCSDGVECSDVEHQVNRRTELKILQAKKEKVDEDEFMKQQALDPNGNYGDCHYVPVARKE